jgi:hypothetical protein
MSIAEFSTGAYTGNAQLYTTGGSSQVFVAGGNLATANTQYVRIETPFSGDASIEHNVIGASRNLGISSTGNMTLSADNVDLSSAGRLIIPSLASGDYIDYNPAGGKLSITTDNTGGALNPLMFLQNTNATGSVALEVYKNKPTAGANGDALFTQSVFGKDSGNAKQEYTRITHTIRDPTAGSEEGSIELGCFINGSYANMIQLNGNDPPSGEVNVLRPIDLSTGSTGLIKTSGSGSTNISIDATTSVGAGNVNLTAKGDCTIVSNGAGGAINLTSVSNVNVTATGDNLSLTGGSAVLVSTPLLEFQGAALEATTAGADSGKYLVITLNGTKYKISLLNDT